MEELKKLHRPRPHAACGEDDQSLRWSSGQEHLFSICAAENRFNAQRVLVPRTCLFSYSNRQIQSLSSSQQGPIQQLMASPPVEYDYFHIPEHSDLSS